MTSMTPEWRISEGFTPYPDALAFMRERAAAIRAGTAAEQVWLVEHPPLYTAGTSARPEELTEPERFPTFAAGRGGPRLAAAASAATGASGRPAAGRSVTGRPIQLRRSALLSPVQLATRLAAGRLW